MLQVKDPAIKLFGKTIPFCTASVCVDGDAYGSTSSSGGGGSCSDSERGSSDGSEIGLIEMFKVSSNENQRMAAVTDETVNAEAGGSNVTEEADLKDKPALKKPDKLLPCPRCNSMDTKFCYYNNYNVLQPRHFCKGCQRYWTAGGAMRNVPVGAGRRKSKNAAFQNRYLTMSEVLNASSARTSNGFIPSGSATISGITGSVANVTPMSCEEVITKARRVGYINPSGSCVTASNETQSTQHGHTSLAPSLSNSLAQIPCIPVWPYPWNAAIPRPAFALPFVPPNFWHSTAIPNTWNVPWIASQSVSQTNTNSKPPLLGKHSRDGVMIPDDKSGKQEIVKQPAVLTPKTLRIDHPEEAAKSSIWETLGIKNETISKGGLFGDLKSKEREKLKHVPENYVHLTSNPAALSRSLNFQEVS